MTEQRQKEFSELSARAEECLEHPDVSLPHHKLLLRLWHYPSFEHHVSWFVYAPLSRYEESDSPLVLEVVWNRPFDSQRFSDPLKGLQNSFSLEPTISFRRAELPLNELELKLANLRGIVLPIFVDDGSVALDGESFGVETFGFKSSIRLGWWSECYGEWKAIVAWAEDMRRFLSMCLERQPLTSHAI